MLTTQELDRLRKQPKPLKFQNQHNISFSDSETDTLVVNIHGVPYKQGHSGHAPRGDDPSTFFAPFTVNKKKTQM
jgi:hypothetical protein